MTANQREYNIECPFGQRGSAPQIILSCMVELMSRSFQVGMIEEWAFLGQVVSRADLMSRRGEWKRAGRVVVCTPGVFDLVHPGHIRLLEHARSLGDVLIVAVQGDAAARQRFAAHSSQGRRILRPLTPACERVEVLAALAAVEFVAIFEQGSPGELLSQLAPDIVVDAGEAADPIKTGEPAKRASYRLVHIPPEPGYSTTRLIERITESPE